MTAPLTAVARVADTTAHMRTCDTHLPRFRVRTAHMSVFVASVAGGARR